MPVIHNSIQDTTNYAVTDQILKVNSCGVTLSPRDSLSVRRAKGRKDYQIIYITLGQGEFFLNGAWQTVHAGQAVLYQPGEAQFYTYPAAASLHCKWIHFSGSEAGNILEKSDLLRLAPLINIGESREIIALFDAIIMESRQMLPCREPLSQALLFELIARIGRRAAIYRDEGAYQARQKIMQAVAYMHAHYAQQQSLEDYAARCGMSKYHFSHLFRACTGQSPYAYLSSLRIDQAKMLLEGTNLPIGEIARECGYDNPLYFSRAFSSHVGCAPLHYRRSCSASDESP